MLDACIVYSSKYTHASGSRVAQRARWEPHLRLGPLFLSSQGYGAIVFVPATTDPLEYLLFTERGHAHDNVISPAHIRGQTKVFRSSFNVEPASILPRK